MDFDYTIPATRKQKYIISILLMCALLFIFIFIPLLTRWADPLPPPPPTPTPTSEPPVEAEVKITRVYWTNTGATHAQVKVTNTGDTQHTFGVIMETATTKCTAVTWDIDPGKSQSADCYVLYKSNEYIVKYGVPDPPLEIVEVEQH
jgi:hypothetical protein